MTPMEHYREAEALLRRAEGGEGRIVEVLGPLVALAQAHATLATVPDAQYRPMR